MYLKQDEKHSTRQKGGEKFSMAVDDANLLSCDEKKKHYALSCCRAKDRNFANAFFEVN